jgi:hypothetical protein
MRLIFVNEIGADYKGQKQYEFIFSTSTEIDMDEWFVIPASASSRPKSPELEYVDLVGLLKNTNLDMELVQNSDYFGVIDAVDGVVALAWQKFDINSDEPRLTFKFGESFESVNKKIKNKDFTLITEEIKTDNI